MSRYFRATAPLSAFMVLTLMSVGCGKGKSTTDTASGAVAPAPAAFSVVDVETGRHLGADKRISDKTSDFATSDTIFATVHTTGSATNKAIAAKWTFENGTLVDERSETISPTGDAYTEFHIVKPSGWPKGKYTLHVMVDGAEAQTKDVTVK